MKTRTLYSWAAAAAVFVAILLGTSQTAIGQRSARYVALHSVKITDSSGASEILTHPRFAYSDSHLNYFEDGNDGTYSPYIEVIVASSPRTVKSIKHVRITTAEFQYAGEQLAISVTLDDGQTISGILPDAELVIEGKGALGDVRYAVKDVKTIEFLEFCNYPANEDERRLLEREEAVRRWEEERRVRRWEEKRGALPGVSISDGSFSFVATGLCLRDSYDTNERGNVIYFNRRFREHYLRCFGGKSGYFDKVTVRRGVSEIDVSLRDLPSLEITGRLVGEADGQRPEVIVSVPGVDPQTAVLVLEGESSFEEDDMLVWLTEFGYEGRSLTPLRRIVLMAASP